MRVLPYASVYSPHSAYRLELAGVSLGRHRTDELIRIIEDIG